MPADSWRKIHSINSMYFSVERSLRQSHHSNCDISYFLRSLFAQKKKPMLQVWSFLRTKMTPTHPNTISNISLNFRNIVSRGEVENKENSLPSCHGDDFEEIPQETWWSKLNLTVIRSRRVLRCPMDLNGWENVVLV